MAAPRGASRQCPRCGMAVPAGAKSCPRDGTAIGPTIDKPAFTPGAVASERTVIDPRRAALEVLPPTGEQPSPRPIAQPFDSPGLDDDRTVLDIGKNVPLGGLPSEVTDKARVLPFELLQVDPSIPGGLDETVVREEVIRPPPLPRRPSAPRLTPLPADAQAAPRKGKGGDPLIGSRIGEYQVEERIGAGGMGIVYRGIQPVIGKPVAIKVLKPEIAGQQGQMERLLAEARAVNAIRHRGIIDIFSFGQLPDGRHYVVMEYLEGEAFDAFIKKSAPTPLSEAIPLLEEILSALGAAHSAGVIHRDLKPSNIFVVTPPHGPRYLKLLDFGLAKQSALPGGSTPQTRMAMIVGTPDYMSPEQARGEPVGPFTDLYSLGVMAFQLLTGKLPFVGETPMIVLIEHQERPPPRASTLNGAIPPLLDNLLLRLMAKSPSARPASAAEVEEILSRVKLTALRTQEPQSAPEPTRVGRASDPSRGRPRVSTPSLPSVQAREVPPRPRTATALPPVPPREPPPEPPPSPSSERTEEEEPRSLADELFPPETEPEPEPAEEAVGPVPEEELGEPEPPTDAPPPPERASGMGAWIILAVLGAIGLLAVSALLVLRPPWRKPAPLAEEHPEQAPQETPETAAGEPEATHEPEGPATDSKAAPRTPLGPRGGGTPPTPLGPTGGGSPGGPAGGSSARPSRHGEAQPRSVEPTPAPPPPGSGSSPRATEAPPAPRPDSPRPKPGPEPTQELLLQRIASLRERAMATLPSGEEPAEALHSLANLEFDVKATGDSDALRRLQRKLEDWERRNLRK